LIDEFGKIQWQALDFAFESLTLPNKIQAWTPTLQHEQKPGTATLDHLNRVCLYLGVTMLADICDDARRWLQSWALTGYEQARPTIPWPNQGKPGKNSWQIWRRFLKQLFTTTTGRNTQTDKDWILYEDLGAWTTTTPLTMCDAYLVHERNVVYAKHSNRCYVSHSHVQRTTSMYIPTPTWTTAPPNDSTFTPIKQVSGKIICTSLIDKSINSPPDTIIATAFSAFLHQLNPSIK
jgi:hypothetical protein